MTIFRRRHAPRPVLDHAALVDNCAAVFDDLAADFDWRLLDRSAIVQRAADAIAPLLQDDPRTATDLAALRVLLEREISAEYFAHLYDALREHGPTRDRALAELLRAELVEAHDTTIPRYGGYLFRAAVYFVHRFGGRAGWNPTSEQVEDLAQAAAHDVLVAVLRSVELRQGRRAFWAFLSRSVERRVIDHLRALGCGSRTVSLDQTTGADADAAPELAAGDDAESVERAALAGEVARLMVAAHLSQEERFALVAGAHGYSDQETAATLTARLQRVVQPADVRRWRFRGRDKLRRYRDGPPTSHGGA